jgi:hypothetical protein
MTEHEQISIPATQVENSKDNPYRLCEYDTESQKGCRRTNTIFALEAEFDTFVDPEMVWGVWDLYCLHEGKMYYYKNFLEQFYTEDAQNRAADVQNSDQVEVDNFLKSVLTSKNAIAGADSVDAIKSLIQNPPGGFPKFLIETPQFLQFDDPGVKITIDSLDKTTLDKIKNTFNGDVNPLLSNLNDRLFIKNDQISCVDLMIFDENPTAKFGVIMVPSESEKYDATKAYFFPFAPLTAEQTEFVTKLTAMEGEFQRSVEIVNL